MAESPAQSSAAPLKLLPAYLGTSSIEEAAQTARGRRVLWLEILVNDRLDHSLRLDDPLCARFTSQPAAGIHTTVDC